MIRRAFAILLAALVISTAAPARAGFVVDVRSSVTPQPDIGIFTYTYLVSNPIENADDGDPDLIFGFALEVDPQAALSSIASPAGWEPSYSPGASQIEWSASDLPFALAPGDFLLFGFVSRLGPVKQGFSALAINQGGTNVDFVLGTTSGPAVPAPASWTLLSMGIVCLFGYGHSQRKSV